ncbi:meprin A subunit beta-like [Alosa alosa]|uniref:meprin A subunit beta-like n=1 Tax=Alosa alosa TaxID=278164 RepID=UPI0020151485|nr:meprin A subunit beta-like [Alosa alosa]
MKQTLSIGTYCDHISVVEHEFLHALGFLHEQSRYDRKDFITINWYNIGQGHCLLLIYSVLAFVHKGWTIIHTFGEEITSTMGTPYDYWSVMHYSQSAFSYNKGPHHCHKGPRFQDVIGQHLDMRFYDTLELNRRYNCNDSIFFLDHCSFDEGMCEMSSAGWERVSRADEGPQSDHTYLGMESQGDISVQVYSGVDR